MLLVASLTDAAETRLDDFENLAGWTATASEGARVWIAGEPGVTGAALRVGFDLGPGGYVIVRKTFALTLPENYAFTFQVRGEGRPSNFEFKLIDAGGKSVWWRNQREFAFPKNWQRMTIRRSRVELAWGRSPGGHLKKVGAIEFAISGGEGAGAVWIDDLVFEEREPVLTSGGPPDIAATTSAPDHPPTLMLDGDGGTTWRSEPLPRDQWVLVDHRRNWEYGGLVIDWDAEDYATQYAVQVSNDNLEWTTAFSTTTGHGGRSYVYMPDAESRYTRLVLQRSSRGQGYGIATLAVQPPAFSSSPNAFFEAIARDSAPGAYPKYLYGRQTYWTVVGVDEDDKEGLVNEEGMLEVDRGAFSIEPFLYTDGKLVTWSNVETTQSLEDGYLPIPTVTWRADRLTLRLTTFAAGDPRSSILYARYRVENHSDSGAPVHLFLALRPFQVTPPWQSLNMNGGTTRIQEFRYDGRGVWVDEKRVVVALTPPDQFGAATFEEGSITDFLRAGKVPARTQVTDSLGFASGALRYSFYLAPRDREEVVVAVPFHDPYAGLTALAGVDAKTAERRLDEVKRGWQSVLNRVEFGLPHAARALPDALRSTLAYLLINRDGPAIQPGSRNYARSWIRDGALSSTALLEMGSTEAPREFLRWYVRYQGPDGKVPCCVDRRGPDPVSEHDSAGALIFGIMEYYRYTRDVGFVADLWPHVIRAVDYLTALRARRLGEEYRAPVKRAYYGLLPESISHEGYAAQPVHSYWDDFFALRGLRDAADLAVVMGDDERAAKYAALRDQFRENLYGSIERTMADHRIDYIPGSVELGDFDPTSTAVAIVPGGELGRLPEPALTRTFDRYWDEFTKRRDGGNGSEAYSAYEWRNVAALVRLGQKDRALQILAALLADERPPGWNQWPEISWHDKTAPRFIGDMPHTWAGATFIHAARSLFAYERDADRSLVIGAGIAPEWLTADPGVRISRLPTHYGVLGYTARATGPDAVRFRLSGDLTVPPGGIVVMSPLARSLRAVTVGGAGATPGDDGSVVLRALPAEVVFEYGAAAADGEQPAARDGSPPAS